MWHHDAGCVKNLELITMRNGNRGSVFTRDEQTLIASWWEKATRNDLRIEIKSGFDFIGEGLLVIPRGANEPLWMVHKTDTGAVAVRLWPGLAEIFSTLPEALAIITHSSRTNDAERQLSKTQEQ
jgi:hypothetical protein